MDPITFSIVATSVVAMAALAAWKRSQQEEWEQTHPAGTAPVNKQGGAAYLVRTGRFVRGLDMNRRTRANEITPHWGVDVAAPIGTPVYAVRSGTVVFAGAQNGYGNAVSISHDDGSTSSHYGHLDSQAVSEGQEVRAGDHIGNVGTTTAGPSGIPPFTIGPHLHMEVHPRTRPAFGRTTRRSDPVVWLRNQGTELFGSRW